jgi:hypothetical protein
MNFSFFYAAGRYYKLEFSDAKVSSKVVGVKGRSRHMMNPEWHFELWLPVTVPTATSRIKHSVWDYDTVGAHDLAGIFYTNLKELQKKRKTGPTWMNLYGSPLQSSTFGSSEWRKKYNEHPDLGGCYRGRVLVSQKLRDSLPKKEIEADRPAKPWKRKVKPLAIHKYPSTEFYVLRVDVMCGNQLPQLTATMDKGRNRKLGISVSCGKFQVLTERAANHNGCCDWNHHDAVTMELPRYIFEAAAAAGSGNGKKKGGGVGHKDNHNDSFPDVLVHLFTGKTGADFMPICFLRLKAKDLLEEGFNNVPFKWHTLKEDKVLDKLTGKTFPGCLLLRLGLGTSAAAEESAEAWSRVTSDSAMHHKVPYIVRVNIFQCRDLPAADGDGMIDPYLKVNVLGAVQQTSKKNNTRDPMFYESFDFKTEIIHGFGLQLAPRVCLQVWDSDFGFGSENDDYCGCCMLDLKEAFVDASPAMDEYTLNSTVAASLPTDLPPSVRVISASSKDGGLKGSDFPDPKWVPFMIEEEGDGEGALLASVQLIPSSPGHALSPPPPDILPETVPAFLEITSLGCRGLIPYKFLPITLPRVEFVLQTAEETFKQSTPESKTPSPSNPNYLRYDVIEIPKFPKKVGRSIITN